ncbi:hypothetical protein JW960_16485 [candidate division KSB1 bacterium]|nr:hypothetical protein [candidate division KSB1 bacterium]
MRILYAIGFDIRFQFRHGFYYAYLFVSVFYILGLLSLTNIDFRQTVTTLMLFTDTTMLGFFFIGALVLLEKSQRIHESLFITPYRLYEYFISKVVSLTIISMTSSLAIVLAVHRHIEHPVIFVLGLALSSCFFTLFGFIFAARANNVNDYFAKALALGMAMSLPLIDFLDVFKSWIFYLFPSQATLIMINSAFKDYSIAAIIYSIVSLIAWSALIARVAYRSFYNNIIYKIGSGV